jgi:hypothetical protein
VLRTNPALRLYRRLGFRVTAGAPHCLYLLRGSSPLLPGTVIVGDSLSALDTPAMLVELPIMERNIERMPAAFRDRGVSVRPHLKPSAAARAPGLRVKPVLAFPPRPGLRPALAAFWAVTAQRLALPYFEKSGDAAHSLPTATPRWHRRAVAAPRSTPRPCFEASGTRNAGIPTAHHPSRWQRVRKGSGYAGSALKSDARKASEGRAEAQVPLHP